MTPNTLDPPGAIRCCGKRARDPGHSSFDVLAAVLAGGSVYVTWGLATYLLEGARHTLLRPEAQADRLAYAVVANLLAGTILPLWALRVLDGRERLGRPARSCPAACTAISVGAAGLIGLALLVPLLRVVQAPVAYLNVFAQVLPTSVAEVLVCWVMLGGVVDVAVAVRTCAAGAAAGAAKWVLGAALFGLYHFAHSPPYDTWPAVASLTGIGLLTGAFFLVSGDVYGTILLHSGLATVGVMGSVAQNLSHYVTPQPLLYLVAAASVLLLVVLDIIWFRSAPRTEADRRVIG